VYELRWRDGGPSGADVLRRIIASIPDYLAQGGIAQLVTHLGERDGESYLDRVRRWLAGANLNLHALKIGEEALEDYAINQVAPQGGLHEDYAKYATTLKAWVDNLKAQRFARVLSIVLTFEWNDEGTNPPWTREDEAKPPKKAIGQELARVLQGKRRTRGATALRGLDRCRAGVPDDLMLVERRRPTGHGFETKDFRVTWKDPVLAPELEIKPLVRDLLERVDNRSTVPEIIARYARDTKVPVEEVDERCRRAFLAMLERGLVTLDEVDAAAARPEVPAQRPAEDDLISAPHVRPRAPQPAAKAPTAEELMAISSHDLEDPEELRKLAEVDGALAALAAVANEAPTAPPERTKSGHHAAPQVVGAASGPVPVVGGTAPVPTIAPPAAPEHPMTADVPIVAGNGGFPPLGEATAPAPQGPAAAVEDDDEAF
jgi:hypothetical protein